MYYTVFFLNCVYWRNRLLITLRYWNLKYSNQNNTKRLLQKQVYIRKLPPGSTKINWQLASCSLRAQETSLLMLVLGMRRVNYTEFQADDTHLTTVVLNLLKLLLCWRQPPWCDLSKVKRKPPSSWDGMC